MRHLVINMHFMSASSVVCARRSCARQMLKERRQAFFQCVAQARWLAARDEASHQHACQDAYPYLASMPLEILKQMADMAGLNEAQLF